MAYYVVSAFCGVEESRHRNPVTIDQVDTFQDAKAIVADRADSFGTVDNTVIVECYLSAAGEDSGHPCRQWVYVNGRLSQEWNKYRGTVRRFETV